MTTVWIVWTIAETAFAAATVYGGVTGKEVFLGAGAAGLLLGFVLAPGIAMRAKRRQQLAQQYGLLARFEYSIAETEEIAAAVIPDVRKRSVRLSILFSVCFVIIFTPFIIISAEKGNVPPALVCTAAVCVVLPWLSLAIAPAVTVRTIRNYPCVSIIGRNCVLIANRYSGLNDRYALTAEDAIFVPGKDGGMAVLRVCYRFRAGRVPVQIRQWVEVPVPRGRETEAEALKL